ncbi:cob(I)yrinic acid a,c-diamide adenosyltransferase [Candidatus Daviesbacteria bacterium RIFCSPLOWO2_02_FULL_41_8]|uniref:Cob(I)yrinic acid a,c-diamide adenosyltransferase n=2 Tax=Candidatus Daviesiibacteriota TaxID=1752718 RepID=A0A1F5NM06_9BACT|nr:MAG: cob(I)yrinic acid a,c-diamide adenosyltransferase [Candidatus Daviesbacteria bacterium RIFCSPHIGHO2_02_FULL_41_10]OGE78695.1 MAG: cob(I)yrinic acid a,c-diamide adenosyltransferase [Candidatus Daviesbacteria bacterium RIFCSPLOWO2_02_FULL_41_8]
MNDGKGLVIIYTGEGKGKTTAALGLVLRAVGYKKKCLIVQFGKMWFTGEVEGVKKLAPFVKLVQGGKGFVKILGDKLPLKEHKKAAKETFQKLHKEMMSGKWDVVVADEIVGAVSSGLLTEKQAVTLITDKPKLLDLILTGHHVSEKLIQMADLVTEMREVKHPYQKGILAKKGLDF